ncbi:MAG TPA: HEAT repeat domain-containing protein [Terracidiphilus sp.]|nr:HEAT repeat domain-containing protein [Terracidiphilus sp.]
MAHRGFDDHMQALDAMKDRQLDAEQIGFVKKTLAHRSNLLVAKAARLAEDNQLTALVPDLLAAFKRFFENPEKTDPQCWAKNALSRALPRLECRDKDVYLRGLHHHQMEPVWGGRSDSAGSLRANCAHALAACEGIANHELLLLLLDLLVDADKSVRVEAIRAIAQIGDPAVPLLRLRALIPGEEPEVLGTCMAALLSIDRDASIPFVAQFLAAADDAAAEAAFALAETRSPAALALLLDLRSHPNPAAGEPWFAGVLLSAIALTRLPQAFDYLIGLIEEEDREASLSIESLAKSAPCDDVRSRIDRAVESTGSPRLKKAFDEHFPPPR